MKKFIFALVFLFSVKLYPFAVSVTEWGKIVRYPKSDLTYYLGTKAPYYLSADVWSIFDASFKTWENVFCTKITFTKLGTTNVSSVLPTGAEADGKNEVIWADKNVWNFDNSVLGVTVPLYNINGTIIESDIAFNPNVPWSTNDYPSGYSVDLQSVATHEIGHFFGLQHALPGYGNFNYNDPPTMAPQATTDISMRTLEEDDKNGVCFLYPKTEYTCYSNTDCPYILSHDQYGQEYYSGQFTCENGKCVSSSVVEGTKGYGEECSTDNPGECKSPYFCQPFSTGTFCTQMCDPNNNDCPDGNPCLQYQNSNEGACLPIKQKDLGEACNSGYDCKSGLCFPNPTADMKPDNAKQYCRESCLVSKQNCPSGYKCVSYTGIDYGGCLPESIIPKETEKKNIGESCAKNEECKTNICYQWYCRQQCDLNTNNCPQNEHCEDVGGYGLCLPGQSQPPTPKEEDEECLTNSNCKSNFCFAPPGTGDYYCRTTCKLAENNCSPGHVCISFGDANIGVCMPKKLPTGSPCNTNSDCTTGLCHWTINNTVECVQSCIGSDKKCDEGYICVDTKQLFNENYGNVCLPAQKKDEEKKEIGEKCTSSGDCKTGLCFNEKCSAACNIFQENCDNSEDSCYVLSDGNIGACVVKGEKQIGDNCISNSECETLFCEKPDGEQNPVCLKPCDLQNPSCDCKSLPGYAVVGFCAYEKKSEPSNSNGNMAESQSSDNGGIFCATNDFSKKITFPVYFLIFMAVIFVQLSFMKKRRGR